MTAPGPNPGGDFISHDKSIYGDEVRGHKFTTRSPLEELRDYLAAAVPSYASAQMQRVLNAQSQQTITEPYKFLDPFDLEDANIFFGRSAAVQSLYQAVTTNRLTVLHAKPGAGKTSLLNAGLAPRLLTTRRIPIFARAFQDPVQAVKRAVAPGSAGPWPEMLHKLSLSEFLALVKQYLPPHVQEVVLVLDQFEEFFIFWPLREQRQPFIDNFAQCYGDTDLPVRFVLSLRKDFYSDLAEFESYIPSIFRSQLRLEPMERTQVAEAIIAPVNRLGNPIAYAPDLIDAILDDLGGSGMELPHMQIICTRLFEDAVSAGVKIIGLPKYQMFGRAQGILGNYLNDMLARFPGRSGKIAKMVLKELVSSEATKRTLSHAILASRVELPPAELNQALIRLVNARLLRRDEVDGEITYEMAHEYLIAEIKQWIDSSDLAVKQVEELLTREVITWRIHHTLIPRDRLELIYAQRARLGRIDDVTGECLLRSALQSNFSIEDWMHYISEINIQPLLVLLQDASLGASYSEMRRRSAMLLGSARDARAVMPLIDMLKDADANVREEASEALGNLGGAALEPLIRALKDEDANVREAAAEALEKVGDTRAVDALIAVLNDMARQVRRAAADALGQMGDARAVEPLVTALKDTNAQVRWAAADALGKLGDTSAVAPLIAVLKDTDAAVREGAAEALDKLGHTRAMAPLIAALDDADANVRRAAAAALGQLGDARAIEPLVAALKDADANERRAAAVALGQLGDASAVAPLIAALKDANWYVRSAASEALSKLDEAAVGPLINALADVDRQVRKGATDALGKLGEAAVEPLTTALKNADWYVREGAAEALGKLGDTRAVAPLIAALKDANWYVREGAAEALGKLGDAHAVAPLITALRDSEVRTAASEALGKLGEAAVEPLIAVLNVADANMRRAAAAALGSLGEAALEPLIAVLSDADANVREAAAEALGQLGDARALEPLIAAANDADANVRRAAAAALGQIGDVSAVAPLIAALKDTDENVRSSAAAALGLLSDVSAVAPLIAALKDADVDVRRSAAVALGQLGDANALASLIAALKDADANVRWAAAGSLGQLGDAGAVASLIAALKDADANVREGAAAALGKLGDAAVEPLIDVLSSAPNVAVYSAAADALKVIGTPEALAALKRTRR